VRSSVALVPRAKRRADGIFVCGGLERQILTLQAQIRAGALSKVFSETIGIERKTVKANGTPTVHYRLDETQLVNKLAFLEVPFSLQNSVMDGFETHPMKIVNFAHLIKLDSRPT